MHSKNDNIKVMIFDKAGDNLQKSFELFLSIYQIGL